MLSRPFRGTARWYWRLACLNSAPDPADNTCVASWEAVPADRSAIDPPADGVRGDIDVLRSAIPFGAVGVLALASLALPPGPRSLTDAVAATGLLALAAVALYFLRDRVGTSAVSVVVPLIYTGAVLLMILATGSAGSGVGVVMMAPLVWAVLYHRRGESAVVLLAVLVVQLVTAFTPVVQPDVTIVRRMLFWTILAVLLAVASHGLRDALRRQAVAREDALNRTISLERAAAELTALSDPDDLLEAATRLAAHVVSPPGVGGRGAYYCRVENGAVRLVTQYVAAGEQLPDSYPLADHPHLLAVLASGQAETVDLQATAIGPTFAPLIDRAGVTHVVYVPVIPAKRVDGALVVAVQCPSVSTELFELCKALGHLLELALANAIARRELEREAATDALTGLLNRRGFERSAANRPTRRPFVLMSIDLDGLKAVNDAAGHDAGDALLVRVAGVLRSTMRRGDLLARLGGDEFAALLFDADESDGRIAAERMLAAIATSAGHLGASVSIGVAAAAPHDDPDEALSAADTAMYVAKRSGGRTYHVARSLTAAC
jgi:diguanylate cyclase (GGDEF)-like protein